MYVPEELLVEDSIREAVSTDTRGESTCARASKDTRGESTCERIESTLANRRLASCE